MRQLFNKEFTKKILLVFLSDLFVKLRLIFFIPLIAKIWGVTLFGIWTQLSVTISMLLPILLLGMNFGLPRFISGGTSKQIKDEVAPIFYLVIAVCLVFALPVIFLSGKFSRIFFGSAEYSMLIKFFGIYIITMPLKELLLVYFRAREKFLRYSVLIIIDTVFSIVFTLYFIKYGFNFIFTGLIVSNLLLIIATFFLTRGEINFDLINLGNINNLKKYLVYSVPLIPVLWLIWVNNSSDRYFIGYFLNLNEVGFYSVAYTLSCFVLNIIGNPIFVIFQPVLMRLWNNSEEKLATILLNDLIKFLIYLMIPFCVIFFVIAKTIILKFTSTPFVSGVPVIPLILLGYGFYILTVSIEIITYMTEANKKIVSIYFISALCNVIMNIILIPVFGIFGAAISTAASFGMQLLLTWLLTRRYVAITMNLFFICKCLFAALIMGSIIGLLPHSNIISSFLTAVFGSIIYLIISIVLRTFKMKDLNVIVSVFSKVDRPINNVITGLN